jgi:alkenylglycerophosphocholine/alkenylglycerophosphoethanolamine hydrolase
MLVPKCLVAAAALSGLLAIACEIIAEHGAPRPRAFYLLKPLTSALIAASLFAAPHRPDALLVAAFAFAIVGDIALMFDGDKAFLAGLGSFFCAHLGFVAEFIAGVRGGHLPWWTLAFVAYALALFIWLLPKAGALKIPTLAYGAVLTAMVLAAAAAQAAMPGMATRCALTGALLFAASDSALAVRQFVGPYRGAQPLILSSYWLAIGLIAISRWP